MEAFGFTKTLHHDTYDAISPSKANLTGRVVAITGATRGIGRALAVSYARAKVSGLILMARGDLKDTQMAVLRALHDEGKHPPKILLLNVDVVSRSSVEAAASRVAEAFAQGIDILVNNAGYLEKSAPMAEADPDAWWQSYEVNTKGMFLVSRSFIPQLLKKDNGLKNLCILSSIGAVMMIPGMTAYNTCKLANSKLAEYLQAEYGAKGLIAYSVHPGGVDTELARNLDESMHSMFTETPELAADAILWFSKERREWIGGRFLLAQWDADELEARRSDIEEKDLLKISVGFGST